jgi:RHS repeat-associated protein
MTATNNYWGSPSGPFHPTLNPDGVGAEVSDRVIFEPWLREPIVNVGEITKRTATDYSSLSYNPLEGRYTRTYVDGTMVFFTPEGYHDYTLAPDGRRTVYSYNPDGSVATMGIVPPNEDVPRWLWTFAYENGRLTTITDPAGRITLVTIDEQGNLTQFTTPDGATQGMAYDERSLLTHFTDQNGAITTHVYDNYGRVTTIIDPVRTIYDPLTAETTITQTVRTITTIDSGYPLINDLPTGDPENPLPPAPQADDLTTSISYGRGERTGLMNKWGFYTSETDGLNRTTSYERNDRNERTGITYPDGDCRRLSYNEDGQIISDTQLSATECGNPQGTGHTWQTTYEPRFGQVKTETDPLGRTTTYVYDYEENVGTAGKLIRVEHPAVDDGTGQIVVPTERYTYNPLGLVATYTDPRGIITQYVYTQGTAEEAADGNNPLFAAGVTPVPGLRTQIIVDMGGENFTTVYRNFDGAGNPQTMIAPGGRNVTEVAYDALNRMISHTDALGYVTEMSYDGRGNLTHRVDDATGRRVQTTHSYDANDRTLTTRVQDGDLLTQETNFYDVNGLRTAVRDGRGYVTRFVYDDADQLIRIIDPTDAEITRTYYDDGLLATEIDAAGSVREMVYDGYNRLIRETYDAGGLDLTTITTYDSNSNVTTVTQPDGTMTCYSYDEHDRRVSETYDCGPDGENLTVTMAYDLAGNVVRQTDWRGTVTTYSYDGLNRRVETVQDVNGLALTTSQTYDTAGNLQETVNVRGIVTRYSYDDLNRLVQVCRDSGGLNLCETAVYNGLGQTIRVVDANGVATEQTEYVNGGRRTFVQDADNTAVATHYRYDSAGNLSLMIDGNGHETAYEYTVRNELARTIYADGTAVSNTYDDRGLPELITQQDNSTITHEYDLVGRLVARRFSDGSTQFFYYDQLSRLETAVQEMDSVNSTLAYTYNGLGDVLTAEQTLPQGRSWRVNYSYDYANGTQSITYPSGVEVTHTTDALGRLSRVQEDNAVLADYAYADTQGFFTKTIGNGISTQFTLDSVNRVSRIHSSIADYRYGYDDVDNRLYVQRMHLVGQPADVRTYDGLYQVTEAWYGANGTTPANITTAVRQQTYTLDGLGNRLAVQEEGDTAVNYTPNNGRQLLNPMNRYEQIAGQSLSYDQRGNTLNDGEQNYGYDLLNRQTSVNDNISYVYDALGRRLAAIVDGETTYFVYGFDEQVLEEYNSSNQLQARYTYGDYVDEPVTMMRNGETVYYHHDVQYSVTELTDSAGNVVERYAYDLYGQPFLIDDAGWSPLVASAVGNPYLFTGRRYDTESGNYFFRARMYQPEHGRFLQMDPLGFIDGANLYTGYFAPNSIDPTGLCECKPYVENINGGKVSEHFLGVNGDGKKIVADFTTEVNQKNVGSLINVSAKAAVYAKTTPSPPSRRGGGRGYGFSRPTTPSRGDVADTGVAVKCRCDKSCAGGCRAEILSATKDGEPYVLNGGRGTYVAFLERRTKEDGENATIDYKAVLAWAPNVQITQGTVSASVGISSTTIGTNLTIKWGKGDLHNDFNSSVTIVCEK